MKSHNNRAAKVGGRYASYANGGQVGKLAPVWKKGSNGSTHQDAELQAVLRSNRAPLPYRR